MRLVVLAGAVLAVGGCVPIDPWLEDPFVVDEPSDTVCHLVSDGDWWCPPGTAPEVEWELENPSLGGFRCSDSTEPGESECFEVP